MFVEMSISGIIIDPVSNTPVIVLKEITGKRMLPIWIGIMEASAIAAELEKVKFPRPMTHDLLKNVIEELNGQVTKVVVNDLKENTYFATIFVESGGIERMIDSRPSDAIALAVRTNSPIFIDERVIEKSKGVEPFFNSIEDEGERDKLKKKWSEILDSLNPEDFGKYKM